MHFEVSGTGDIPLVCIHGWGCHGGQFTGLAEALESDFRIYRLDLPGHGATPLGDFAPGFDNYADAIASFVAEQGLQRPILLGHSMGGVLALMAGMRFPHRAIINLDGGLPPAAHTRAGQGVIRSWLDLPDLRERLAGAFRESFFLPGERDARCESIIRTMCSAPVAVLRFLPEQIGDLDAAHVLPLLSAPVIYIGTARSRFDFSEAKQLLAQAEYTEISEAGHFCHIYALHKVTALVKAFAQAHGLR